MVLDGTRMVKRELQGRMQRGKPVNFMKKNTFSVTVGLFSLADVHKSVNDKSAVQRWSLQGTLLLQAVL